MIGNSTSYRGRNSRPNWLALLLSVALAFSAGAVGVLFSPLLSPTSAAWYGSLMKPPWTPPVGWLGPIGSAIYVLMGISAWLVWRERYHQGHRVSLIAYALQLVLNAAWAPVFFGGKNIGAGLFLIVALWLSLAWTFREFIAVRAAAAWLLLPYLACASFAVTLSLSIWRRNP